MSCVINIDIANPHAVDQRKTDVHVKVDPGKVYTYLPRKMLEKLGLKPVGKMDFMCKSGKVIQREVGYALISYQELEAVVAVAFIEPQDRKPATIGLTGLESLGLKFDAASSDLKRVIPTIPLLTEV